MTPPDSHGGEISTSPARLSQTFGVVLIIVSGCEIILVEPAKMPHAPIVRIFAHEDLLRHQTQKVSKLDKSWKRTNLGHMAGCYFVAFVCDTIPVLVVKKDLYLSLDLPGP
jgi:hypothetical protein